MHRGAESAIIGLQQGAPRSSRRPLGALERAAAALEGRPVMDLDRFDNQRVIRAPRGAQLTARSWQTEAPLRMLMNNLDAEVAESPQELVVYGGIGRAARNWRCYDVLVETLKTLAGSETLRVQSRKPVGDQSGGSRRPAISVG